MVPSTVELVVPAILLIPVDASSCTLPSSPPLWHPLTKLYGRVPREQRVKHEY